MAETGGPLDGKPGGLAGGLPEAPLARLVAVMARLRDPDGGCPWDLEQTWATIAPYTIEEAYEVADAIERQDFAALRGELGDLLFQVVYYAQIGAEEGRFDLDAIAAASAEKMVARHPHVFAEAQRADAGAQTAAWEAGKAAERAASGETRTLDGVPLGLPALTRALKLQKRAARVGFDWPDVGPVADKVAEEAQELAAAAPGPEREEEYGDLLFALVNLGRQFGIDPETALRRANAKFARRFGAVEDALAARGRTPAESDLAEMDALWDAAKRTEQEKP